MAPVLVPCLIALRAEFNAVSPDRDKASDGWLGDRAHALSSSDHNGDESGNTPYEDADNVDEVHGLDIDDTGPWPWTFDAKIEHIRAAHAAGRDDRLQNIIRNGRIASRSWGWAWRAYAGSNGHYQHCHFSARYATAQESDVSPWGVAPIREVPTVTTPTHEQLKAGATAGVLGYTGGGLPGGLAAGSNFLNYFTDLYRDIAAQSEDVDSTLDAIGSALVNAQVLLALLVQDPAAMDDPETHPVVRAIRYATANPAPPAA